jgi:hypothetical protein
MRMTEMNLRLFSWSRSAGAMTILIGGLVMLFAGNFIKIPETQKYITTSSC